ncbi:hypothetical protein [Streptomyces venezuelae]|uniref:hypothetical protein n=1 Tax=Streptomyces venezuelae TaxID=54571 RepID=UPI003F5432AC
MRLGDDVPVPDDGGIRPIREHGVPAPADTDLSGQPMDNGTGGCGKSGENGGGHGTP